MNCRACAPGGNNACKSSLRGLELLAAEEGEHFVARKPKIVKSAHVAPKSLPKLPFSMGDRGQYIRKAWVAVAPMGKTILACLYYEFAWNRVNVAAVPISEINTDHTGTKPFFVDGHHTGLGPTVLAQKTHLPWLKIQALQGGATPDAIRYMGQVMKLTKNEEAEMASRLKKNAETPAKTKPVGKGGKVAGAKKGGNPEALEKAREAAAKRNAENAAKKITVLVKPADVKLRGGRKAKFDWVAKNKPKTVGDAIGVEVTDEEGNTHKIDMGALRGMEKREHIRIG